MRNLQLRLVLSVVTLFSVTAAFSLPAAASPVKFEQVRQIVSAKPGKAGTAAFSRLGLVEEPASQGDDDNKGDDNKGIATTVPQQPQDDRVITTTTSEIVQDEVCDCVQDEIITRGFPKYALLGLGAIPLLFLIPKGRRTPPTFITTPTPPEPVPEPMTILLFGSGLASIGMAARKRLGKKDKEKDEK